MNYIRKIPTENLRVRATKELTALHLLGAFHQNIFYFFNLRRRRLSGIKNRCASYGNQVLISNFAWYPYPRYIYIYIYSIYIYIYSIYIYIYTVYIYIIWKRFAWNLNQFFVGLRMGVSWRVWKWVPPKHFLHSNCPLPKLAWPNAHDFTLLRSVLNGWGLNVFDPSPCWTMWVRKWRIPTKIALQYYCSSRKCEVSTGWWGILLPNQPKVKPSCNCKGRDVRHLAIWIKGHTVRSIHLTWVEAPKCVLSGRNHPKPSFFPTLWGMVTDPIYSFQALYQTSYTGCWHSGYIIQQCKIKITPPKSP